MEEYGKLDVGFLVVRKTKSFGEEAETGPKKKRGGSSNEESMKRKWGVGGRVKDF